MPNARAVRNCSRFRAQQLTRFLISTCDIVAVCEQEIRTGHAGGHEGCPSGDGVAIRLHLYEKRLKGWLRDTDRHRTALTLSVAPI